jgi:SnoaL-like protein
VFSAKFHQQAHLPMPDQTALQSQMWVAKNEICELQRLYAVATDLLCTNTPADRVKATAIYHRIYTPQAVIKASGMDPKIGPDSWVELVTGALAEFVATQHFIGTQIAEIQQLPVDNQASGTGTLFSHLQAWHAKGNGEMWHYIGTYESNIVFTPGIGWQINEMNLQQVSEDYRKLTPRP